MQLFAVPLHRVCLDNETQNPVDADQARQYEWGCGGSRSCPHGSSCIETIGQESPNIAGFDNIGQAMLSAFQVRVVAWHSVVFECLANFDNVNDMITRHADQHHRWLELLILSNLGCHVVAQLDLFLEHHCSGCVCHGELVHGSSQAEVCGCISRYSR